MMRRFLALAAAISIGACSGGGSNSVPQSSTMRSPSSSSSPIAHVVLIVQENRSFDNLFDCFSGTDCVKRGREKVKQGSKWVDKWVTLHSNSLIMKTDIGHCRYSYLKAYDGGKMDGFNLEPKGVCPRGSSGGGPTIGKTAYQYVDPKEIAPYWDMAAQYVLADHLFQTQGSGSFSAHQDLIRGGTFIRSNASLVDTPNGVPWGCDAAGATVTNLLTTGLKLEEDQGPYPCTKDFPSSGSSYKTLRDLLDAKGVSWKYYSPCFSGWKSCADKCTLCAGALLNAFDVIWPVRNGPQWGTNVSMPQTTIFNDIKNGKLASVSWVIPTDNDSDHPGLPVDDGPAWVASVVNAIGGSSYWNTTAIVVVWDDWGGLYDHLKPPFQDNQGGLGFRVPMIVISPYVPQGSVSHTQYEFGSILKYVETNWNLGSLGTTDKRAKSIGDVFNYNQQPRSFTAIPSRHSIRFFREERPSGSGDPE
jgi:phospholipase C